VLDLDGVTARYGAITALHGVSLRVGSGEIVAIIGPNGAGKTTLLSTIAGLLQPVSGSISLDGVEVAGLQPDEMVRRGVALVPQHRRIFADLTVAENLQIGGITLGARQRRQRMEELMGVFPVVQKRRHSSAGYLSGGEAQQLAVVRALMCDPKILLMDEPSLGMAPVLVDRIFELIRTLHEQGRTILLVEQNARRALEIADRAYVLRTGIIVEENTGEALLARRDLFDAYLGTA
jgi:branched-chain amino acid transport system ATP-binding protein